MAKDSRWFKVSLEFEIELPEGIEKDLLHSLEVFTGERKIETSSGLDFELGLPDAFWATGFKLEEIDSEDSGKLKKVDSEITQLD